MMFRSGWLDCRLDAAPSVDQIGAVQVGISETNESIWPAVRTCDKLISDKWFGFMLLLVFSFGVNPAEPPSNLSLPLETRENDEYYKTPPDGIFHFFLRLLFLLSLSLSLSIPTFHSFFLFLSSVSLSLFFVDWLSRWLVDSLIRDSFFLWLLACHLFGKFCFLIR